MPVFALQKLSRKMVHMLAGPGFALCWPLFRHAALSFSLINAVLGLAVTLVHGRSTPLNYLWRSTAVWSRTQGYALHSCPP